MIADGGGGRCRSRRYLSIHREGTALNLEEILTNGGAALAGIMTLVQISPIKIYPWSWLAKLLGRAINAELIAKVDALEKKVEKLHSRDGEKAAIDQRNRILLFGDEAVRGVKHSEEHFNQILEDITEYEAFCGGHKDFKNEKTVLTCARIKDIYKRCLETGDFL